MPNVRPLNQKKYGISKHAFATAYSYCLQYNEWKGELNTRTNTVASPKLSGMPGVHNGSDATANLALLRADLQEKVDRVENTVREAVAEDEWMYGYMLWYVTTEGSTFHALRQQGIPCGSKYFYKVRRLFYFLMAKKI